MDNNLPTSGSEDMMAYIKPRKKSTASKIVFLFAIVAIVAAIIIMAYKSSSGKFRGFLDNLFGKESSSTTTTTENVTPPETTNIYMFDNSLVPEGASGVIPVDLSAEKQGTVYDNKTQLTLSTAQGGLAKANDGKTRVLIVNTHPFEKYTDEVITAYDGNFSASGDENNVADIARDMVIKLVSLGVVAEYLDTGVTAGQNSYENAYKVISEYLTSHPDIRYIIDVHRGTLLDSSGNMLRPVAVNDDEVYAQMKFTVGGAGAGWENVLASVNTLAAQISGEFPAFLMPTEITDSRLNQHLPATVLTLEIGSCANSITEAEKSAEYFAVKFASAVS